MYRTLFMKAQIWVTPENHLRGPHDVYSQLSSCNLQVCVSMGYLDRSMLHATVVVILRKEKWIHRECYEDAIESIHSLLRATPREPSPWLLQWMCDLVPTFKAVLSFSVLSDTCETQLKLGVQSGGRWNVGNSEANLQQHCRTESFTGLFEMLFHSVLKLILQERPMRSPCLCKMLLHMNYPFEFLK